MFDSLDEQEIKDISNDVTNDIDIDQNEVLFDDLPKPEFVVRDKSIEKLSKKIKPQKNLERIAKKIKEKYQKQKQKKDAIKKASKKAINYMKKANYLQTNDDKTVDYNNDTKLDDLSTVGYNSDVDVDITKPMTIKPKTSVTQQQAKKMIKNKKV